MLNWQWDEKVGEVDIYNYDKVVTYSLYQGNAFLIFVYEYTENGKSMYSVNNCFVDEAHAKRALGIDKNSKTTYGDNTLNQPSYKLQEIRIKKKDYKHTKKLISMLVEAFDELTIKLY